MLDSCLLTALPALPPEVTLATDTRRMAWLSWSGVGRTQKQPLHVSGQAAEPSNPSESSSSAKKGGGHRHQQGFTYGAEEFGGQAQVVVQGQEGHPLEPHHDDLRGEESREQAGRRSVGTRPLVGSAEERQREEAAHLDQGLPSFYQEATWGWEPQNQDESWSTTERLTPRHKGDSPENPRQEGIGSRTDAAETQKEAESLRGGHSVGMQSRHRKREDGSSRSHLHDPHQGLGVFLEDVLKGIRREPQDGGGHGCSGGDCLVWGSVTLWGGERGGLKTFPPAHGSPWRFPRGSLGRVQSGKGFPARRTAPSQGRPPRLGCRSTRLRRDGKAHGALQSGSSKAHSTEEGACPGRAQPQQSGHLRAKKARLEVKVGREGRESYLNRGPPRPPSAQGVPGLRSQKTKNRSRFQEQHLLRLPRLISGHPCFPAILSHTQTPFPKRVLPHGGWGKKISHPPAPQPRC